MSWLHRLMYVDMGKMQNGYSSKALVCFVDFSHRERRCFEKQSSTLEIVDVDCTGGTPDNSLFVVASSLQ